MGPTEPRNGVVAACATVLFFVLCAIYQANPVISIAGDSQVNIATALSMVHGRDIRISKDESPIFFKWNARTGEKETGVTVLAMDDEIRGLRSNGRLEDVGHHAQVVQKPGSDDFVNIFGVGASASATPFFFLAELFLGDLAQSPRALWFTARACASAYVAMSAVCLYLASLRFVANRFAMLASLVYGLGTGVWSTSAQGLWQHPSAEFFMAAGIYFLIRWERPPWGAIATGACLGAAVICRPTAAILAVTVAAYLALSDRRRLAYLAAGGVPMAMVLAACNNFVFGSPFSFGQTIIEYLAVVKTGKPGIFSTPFFEGALAQLFSPSRGLLVFSPVLLYGIWGGVVCFRRRELAPLRPVSAAVALIWAIEFKHFDWWSGWSYGYRHIVDTATLLAFLMAPALPSSLKSWRGKGVFSILVAYSIFVQALGAWTFDLGGWNARRGWEITPAGESAFLTFDPSEAERWRNVKDAEVTSVEADIDLPRYRDRLWSWRDSQIVYYLTHFAESRERQRAVAESFHEPRKKALSRTHFFLGQAYRSLGDEKEAKLRFEASLRYDPDNAQAKEALEAKL